MDLSCSKRIFCPRRFNRHIIGRVNREVFYNLCKSKNISANRKGQSFLGHDVFPIFLSLERCTANGFPSISTSVPKSNTNRTRGLTWLHECRQFNGLAGHTQLDQGSMVSLGDVGVQSQLLHVDPRHGHVVVPCHLAYRIRRFLQHWIPCLFPSAYAHFHVQVQFKLGFAFDCRKSALRTLQGIEISRRSIDVCCLGGRSHIKPVVKAAAPLNV